MARGVKKTVKTDKKDEILKAAVEIFSKKGCPGATIRDIASRSGVSVGTIYFYFKNKADILKEIFMCMDHMPLAAYIKSKGDISAEKAVEEVCRRAFDFITKDFKLMMLFFNEATNSSRLSDFFFSEFSKSLADLSEIFEGYYKKGKFRPFDHMRTALLFMAALFALAMFKEGPFRRQLKGIAYEDCIKTMTDVFLNGMLSETPESGRAGRK